MVESTDDMASYDFVPTERPWRDVLCVESPCVVGERHLGLTPRNGLARHDVAAGLGLYSETVEDADGERHVCVSKARACCVSAVMMPPPELYRLEQKPLPGSRHEIEQLKLQSRAVRGALLDG